MKRVDPGYYDDKEAINLKFLPRLKLKTIGSGTLLEKEMKIWKIRPLGVELLIEDPEDDLAKGQLVQIEVKTFNETSTFEGLVVGSRKERIHKNYVGIRWLRQIEGRDGLIAQGGPGWMSTSSHYPQGVAINPSQFGQFIQFWVKEIHSDHMLLVTSIRNQNLTTGSIINGVISFPLTAQIPVHLEISHIGLTFEGGTESLVLRVSVESIDKPTRMILKYYAMQFQNESSINISENIFANGKKGLEGVLSLRAENVSSPMQDVHASSMLDIYDCRSRIVFGERGGRVVRSGRVFVPESSDGIEQEIFVDWPSYLPSRESIVEITRIDVRSGSNWLSDFYQLFSDLAELSVLAQRSWLVVSGREDMAEFYQSLGLNKTGLKYQYPEDGPNSPHEVYIANLQRVLGGEGVSIGVWNRVWREASKSIHFLNLRERDPGLEFRLNVLHLSGRLLSLFRPKS